jgi:ethanolamine ammonia-lyase large subunit
VTATASPSLGTVTWYRLAVAVADRLDGVAGASTALRQAAHVAVEELMLKGVTASRAVATVRATILRLAGVAVDERDADTSSHLEGDTLVARAS